MAKDQKVYDLGNLKSTTGDLVLITGRRESGKSTLIKTWSHSVIDYSPRFSNDRKTMISSLGLFPKKAVIGITGSLPNPVEKPDRLFKELGLLASLQHHVYLLEWNLTEIDSISPLLTSTYARRIASIVQCHGLALKAPEGIARFAGIASRIYPSHTWLLDYEIRKQNTYMSLENERFQQDVTAFVEQDYKEN